MTCQALTGDALTSNEREAANRAEATALLIRAKYRVYRPEADVHGEDLVVRTPRGELLPVQLKSRPTVHPKYRSKGIWMLFPDPKGKLGRAWYLLPHDPFFEWTAADHPAATTETGYHFRYITPRLAGFLREYIICFQPPENDTVGPENDA